MLTYVPSAMIMESPGAAFRDGCRRFFRGRADTCRPGLGIRRPQSDQCRQDCDDLFAFHLRSIKLVAMLLL